MDQNKVINCPIEFMNSLDLSGIPPHILILKIRVPIILLWNINPLRFCNGTRLTMKIMMNIIIGTTILNGYFKVEDAVLPRIPMILPFDFKRLQFPLRLAFAKIINKAQGQSVKFVD